MLNPLIAATSGKFLDGVFGLVDDLFTSDEERERAKLKLLELRQQGRLAQLQVNAQEATHESVFVAGWRPAIGWICGFALAYTFIVQPLATFVVLALGVDFPVQDMPDLDIGHLLGILGGMLGLGYMRTREKMTGTNMNRHAGPPPRPET